ncbi:alkaline phosphatase D family protein [Amphiplicatus metriothermophilus]|uniref:Alkaline phosphatase D n=1 Tax=Amphiplicatus metriothermophilus TaxID=1519374 RepID=A0A239PIS4_9PROT|nr:alkaline phosphatase D family protein [Amphiplicatus metriothermophilus]MBB5517955.1 alkaline phosphatase D [Amphiplicatus metriothermophilus]SNT67712.1 alkaline phosphatase D [Amphiplicatus metriothermophilus]
MMALRPLLLSAASFLLAACAAGGPDAPDLFASPAPEAPDGAIRAVPMPSAPLDASKTLTRIVFASCAHQREDQSIWDRIAAENPDLILYMGDNVYGDVRSGDPALPELKAAYMRLAQSEPFSRARERAPVIVGWDDHDYGLNDAGGDYPYKKQSEALFDYVWALPPDDPRLAHPGTYGAWMIGEEGSRVQVILLDTRYFRSPLKPTDEYGARGKERYLPDPDPTKTMLGEAQWSWLAEELKKPADLRLLVSSIQVIADGHGFEAWRMLPAEREKLYATIREAGAGNLIILSGDRHLAGFYRREGALDYPLFEATSSSLNLPQSAWRAETGDTYVEPGPHRLREPYYEANYGLLDIDWAAGEIVVTIRGADGAPALSERIALDTLR